MFEEFFGEYLVKTGKLTSEQMLSVKEVMKTARVKLGLIAVAEKMLTESQADEINKLQAVMDKRFGDIAVEKGYLTDAQVGQLLGLQGNPYLQFVQAVTDNEFMSMQDVEAAISDYKSDNDFSDDDIVAIKSGDIDKISSVFVKSDNRFVTDLTSLALRNIVRFISIEISLNKLEYITDYKFEHLATQPVVGDHNILLGFAGDNTSLLSIAIPFAHEEFEAIDEDSYDSVCEFINTINGLYASKSSYAGISIDMEPPLFYDNGNITSQKIYKLPMTISQKSVDLIVIIDTDYSIN